MKVNEIFQSIEGEGIRAGELTTFIRLSGCNLRCSYCDTEYAFHEGHEMSIKQICDEVRRIAIGRNVTLTGGEPLIHPDVYELIPALVDIGSYVNVETNGSQVPVISAQPGSLFYTMDYKCPSSGEEDKMSMDAIKQLSPYDVLKFVVGSTEDLVRAMQVFDETRTPATMYLSPVFGKIEPAEIVEFMQAHKLTRFRIQLQMHKYIWEPNKRGV